MNLILTAQFPEDELDSHHQYLWSEFLHIWFRSSEQK